MNFVHVLLVGVACMSLVSCDQSESSGYKSRVDFNARLEPDSKVLSGAGQSADAFRKYAEVMDSSTIPVLYMTYTGLKGKNFKGWEEWLTEELNHYKWMLIPQIGLSMTHDGSPEKHYEQEVAAGKHDTSITGFCRALKQLNRPVYVRIGYEFNGHWNGYKPETYKKAFKRITDSIRKYELNKVATVWCASPDAKSDRFIQYYPGDEYVDWWSVDIFGKHHFQDTLTQRFLDSAYAHKKPVMIGESTPRRIGVNNTDTSWNEWFSPYFELIKNHPHVKAFSYINWNWAKYEMWDDWGDCRLEQNQELASKYIRELKAGIYQHGASKEKTYSILNIFSDQ